MRAAIEKYFIPQDLLSAASLRIFRSKSVLDCVKDNFTTQVTPGLGRVHFKAQRRLILSWARNNAHARALQVAWARIMDWSWVSDRDTATLTHITVKTISYLNHLIINDKIIWPSQQQWTGNTGVLDDISIQEL